MVHGVTAEAALQVRWRRHMCPVVEESRPDNVWNEMCTSHTHMEQAKSCGVADRVDLDDSPEWCDPQDACNILSQVVGVQLH